MLLMSLLHIIFCVYTEIALNTLFIIVHYFFLVQTIQWNEHRHQKIYSTWPLFNLEGFQVIRKPLEWTGHVRNIPSYCKPCCVPEIHKFQIKKTTGYWFWKLLCNIRSLLPSLFEKNFWMAFTSHGYGVQSSVALQLRTFDTHFAQPTSTKILWCLFPFESQYCQTTIQIKHFGLALYLSFNIFLLFSILFLHTALFALLTWEIFTQLFFFSPPCWILCRSIANE